MSRSYHKRHNDHEIFDFDRKIKNNKKRKKIKRLLNEYTKKPIKNNDAVEDLDNIDLPSIEPIGE